MAVPYNYAANEITELFIQFRKACVGGYLMDEWVSISHWGLFEV